MVDRDEALRELGLWPRWRLRGAAPAGAMRDGAHANPAAAANVETATLDEALLDADGPSEARARRIGALGWKDLPADIGACTACALCRHRTRTVPGVGDPRAEWMFIGEGPGAEEDARGEPFVGQAGRLLDAMLAALGLTRERKVFIANVVKCRPPGNRTPEPPEVAACKPYLDRQIELVQPRLIVALGRSAASALLRVDTSIAGLRGRVHRHADVDLIVTYHPAYLLRNLPDKAKAWEDFCFARATLERGRPGRSPAG